MMEFNLSEKVVQPTKCKGTCKNCASKAKHTLRTSQEDTEVSQTTPKEVSKIDLSIE